MTTAVAKLEARNPLSLACNHAEIYVEKIGPRTSRGRNGRELEFEVMQR
jgi:hypothetical protein